MSNKFLSAMDKATTIEAKRKSKRKLYKWQVIILAIVGILTFIAQTENDSKTATTIMGYVLDLAVSVGLYALLLFGIFKFGNFIYAKITKKNQVLEIKTSAQETPIRNNNGIGGWIKESWYKVVAALILFGGTGYHPYSYYEFERWAVCAIGFFTAYAFYNTKKFFWATVFIAIGILYNPIWPFYASRSSWQVFDTVAAIVFIISTFFKSSISSNTGEI